MIWKLKFASWALWSFAATFASLFASLLALLPITRVFRSNCTSVLHPYTNTLLGLSSLTPLLPATLQWWLCLDVTTNATSTQLLGRCKSLPAWETVLWCKTPLRALKAAAYLVVAALGTKPLIASVLANPAFRCSTDGTALPLLLLAPYGSFAAACAMHMNLDNPGYPAIQQRRFVRLQDRGGPIFAAAALTWLAASACSLLLFLLTPTQLAPAIDCIMMAVVSFSYIVALLTAAHLSGLVLAERPSNTHLGNVQVSERLGEIVSRLPQSKHPLERTALLQEAVIQSSYYGFDFWRELFEDHTGSEYWQPLSETCLRELHELCDCTKQCATAVKAAAASQNAPKWNDKSPEAVKPQRTVRVPREQRLLEDYAFRNGTACLRSVQVLRDAAALSLEHDTCGLLQMPPEGVPGIADVVHVLLHTYALLDHFLLNRQRAVPRSLARWFDRLYERLLRRLQGIDGGGVAAHAGVDDLHSVHACLAQTLGKLRSLFGDSLAVKVQEATMYADLKESPVNVTELSGSLLGKVAR